MVAALKVEPAVTVQASLTGTRREKEGVTSPVRVTVADTTSTCWVVVLEGRSAKADATEPPTGDGRPLMAPAEANGTPLTTPCKGASFGN